MSKINEKYRNDVRKAMLASAALGPIGAFSTAADISSIATIWGALLVDVAKKEGLEMTKSAAVRVCSSVIIGAGGYYAGCKAATKLFNAIPFAGTVVAIGTSCVENIIFTYYFSVALISVMTAHSKNDVGNLVQSIVKVFRHFSMFDLGDIACILIG